MEALSIAAASLSVLNGIATLSQTLTTFTKHFKGARRDVDGFLRELTSLGLCLETLRDHEFPFPASLKAQLVGVLDNCDGVVQELSTVLIKHRQAGSLRQLQWSATDGQEIVQLRQRLEAHKSVLEITLEVAELSVLHDVRGDTREILAELATLKLQVAELSTAGPGPNPVLQRFLDDSVTYAESLANPFSDDIEDLPVRNAADNDSSKHASAASPDFDASQPVSNSPVGKDLDTTTTKPAPNPGCLVTTAAQDVSRQIPSGWAQHDCKIGESVAARISQMVSRIPSTSPKFSITTPLSNSTFQVYYQAELHKLRAGYRQVDGRTLYVQQVNNDGSARVNFMVKVHKNFRRSMWSRSEEERPLTFELKQGRPEDFRTVLAMHLAVICFITIHLKGKATIAGHSFIFND